MKFFILNKILVYFYIFIIALLERKKELDDAFLLSDQRLMPLAGSEVPAGAFCTRGMPAERAGWGDTHPADLKNSVGIHQIF